jgi:hypothetical protein
MNVRRLDKALDRTFAITIPLFMLGAAFALGGDLITENPWWMLAVVPGTLGILACGVMNSIGMWIDA